MPRCPVVAPAFETVPERRDVEAAYRLALASLRDWRRCKREYGEHHRVTRVAHAAYLADEAWWREVEAAIR